MWHGPGCRGRRLKCAYVRGSVFALQLIDGQHLGPINSHCVQVRRPIRPCEQNRHGGVLHHKPEALGGIIRVHRHVRTTRLQDRQQAHDQLHGPLHADADEHVRPHTPCPKRRGQPVGPDVEVGVGDGRSLEPDGLRMRRFCRLLLDHRMQTNAGPVGAGGVVESVQDRLLFPYREHRQVACCRFRLGNSVLGEHAKVIQQPCNGAVIEQVGAVLDAGRQAALPVRSAALDEIQAQVKLGGMVLQLNPSDVASGQGELLRRGILVGEPHLKQWAVAQATLGLNPFHKRLKRDLLRVVRRQRLRPRRRQNVGKRSVRVCRRFQDQGVHEEADQRLHVRSRASRNGRSHREIRLARVARKQYLIQCQPRHERRCTMLAS